MTISPVRVVLTSKDSKNLLTDQKPLRFKPFTPVVANNPPCSILIDPRPRFQTIEGFGGAFTEASAYNLAKMSPKVRAQVLKDYFDPVEGNGYNIGRVHMNSSDYGLKHWACVEKPGDVELKSFSLKYDQRYVLPMLKAAQKIAGNKIKLFMSPWSPPPWMKTNGEMIHGGKLIAKYRSAWAQYYVKFIKAYAEQGIKFWGLTVQNEPEANQPFDSCLWTGKEEADFVRDHLGPALHGAGLGHLKLMIWDHNRDMIVERAKTVYDDPEASKYVWGTAFHWYNGDHFDNVRIHHDAFPDKKIFFTEGCIGGEEAKKGLWEQGERYGKSIIKDLNNWTVAWTDWNMILDSEGQPRNVPGFCAAPITVDVKTKAVYKLSTYYYMGHFSRFIKPGAQRILSASSKEQVEVTSFINTDGKIATVLMNRTAEEMPVSLKFEGHATMTTLPANSIATVLFTAK